MDNPNGSDPWLPGVYYLQCNTSSNATQPVKQIFEYGLSPLGMGQEMGKVLSHKRWVVPAPVSQIQLMTHYCCEVTSVVECGGNMKHSVSNKQTHQNHKNNTISQ